MRSVPTCLEQQQQHVGCALGGTAAENPWLALRLLSGETQLSPLGQFPGYSLCSDSDATVADLGDSVPCSNSSDSGDSLKDLTPV